MKRTILGWNFVFAALALLSAVPFGAAAQQTSSVLVVVSDSATNQPLEGVRVTVVGTNREGVTDPTGTVQLGGLAPGMYMVEARRADRLTRGARVTLAGGGPIPLLLALPPNPLALEGIEVEAERGPRSPRLREFYQRAEKASGGYFVTREEIEEKRLRRFTQLFRGIPNIQIIPTGGTGYTIRMGRNLASITDGDCPPRYYVDGVHYSLRAGPPTKARSSLQSGSRSGAAAPATEQSPDLEFHVQEIEGIEVYPGANAPGQYGGSQARCGVILIWTREQG